MILKTLVASAISMATAAGVVWFGTAPTNDASEHPHTTPHVKQDVKSELEERRVEMSSERVEETLVDRRADAPPAAGTRADSAQDKPSVRWIDQYIRRSKDKAEGDPLEKDSDTPAPDKVDTERRHAEARDEARVRIAVKDDMPPTMQRKMELTERLDELSRKSDARKVLEEDYEIETEDGKRRIVKKRYVIDGDDLESSDMRRRSDQMFEDLLGNLRESADRDVVLDGKMLEGKNIPEDMRVFEKPKPEALLDAVDAIESEGLKDQALYSITLYALRHDRFEEADAAVKRIAADDLRGTAISRVAIRLAETGKVDAALEAIEAIEDEELRDIVRVQMIEAVTRPLER